MASKAETWEVNAGHLMTRRMRWQQYTMKRSQSLQLQRHTV